jgi:hypothetical protein
MAAGHAIPQGGSAKRNPPLTRQPAPIWRKALRFSALRELERASINGWVIDSTFAESVRNQQKGAFSVLTASL